MIAGLLLRAVPSLLTDFGVDGNIATMVFGAALLHALITAPRGSRARSATRSRGLASRLPSRRERP